MSSPNENTWILGDGRVEEKPDKVLGFLSNFGFAIKLLGPRCAAKDGTMIGVLYGTPSP